MVENNFIFVKDFSVFKWVASLTAENRDFSNDAIFALLLSVVFVSAVSKNVLTYFSSLLVYREVRRIADSFRQAIFNRYLSFGKLFFDKNNTGHLQNMLLNFTNQATASITGADTAPELRRYGNMRSRSKKPTHL